MVPPLGAPRRGGEAVYRVEVVSASASRPVVPVLVRPIALAIAAR